MDALFLVPVLVSNTVNEKLVPALAKMIERNIILNNAALFKKALEINYASKKRGILSKILRREDTVPIFMMGDGILNETDTIFEMYGDMLLKEGGKPNPERANWERERDNFIRDIGEQEKMHAKIIQNVGIIEDLWQNENDPNIKKELGKSLADLKSQEWEYVKRIDKSMNEYNSKFKGGFDVDIEKKKKADKRDENEFVKLELELQSLAKKIEIDLGKEGRDIEKHKMEKYLNKLQAKKDILGLKTDSEKFKVEMRNKQEDTRKKIVDTMKSAEEVKDIKMQRRLKLKAIDDLRKPLSADDKYRPTTIMTSLDQVEKPANIHFFSQISLEPTILEIPLSVRATSSNEYDRQVVYLRVGVKCVPYVVDNVKNIISIMRESRYMGIIERLFKNSIRKINTKIWFTKSRAINKGEIIDPDEARITVKYSPNMNELNNSKRLAKLISGTGDSSWSTMIVLSTYDFKDTEMMDFIKNYRKMTKYVIGDLVITNETKESVFFCSPRFRNCIEIQFTYLQKVLNLAGVIDYSVVSRTSKAWSKETNYKVKSFSDSLKEETSINVNNDIEKKLLEIIKG